MNRTEAREGKNTASTSSNNNGVIITIYTENPTKSSTRRATPIKTKWTRNRRPGGYYSRRAQLLAYTRELRNGDGDPSIRRHRKKKRWFALPKSVQIWFNRLFRRKNKRWMYERIMSDSDEKENLVGVGEKKADPKASGFRRILRSMLKQVSSCGCKPIKVL